jgi:hypothetical protein
MKLPKIFEKKRSKVEMELDKLKCPEPPVMTDFFMTHQADWEAEVETYELELRNYQVKCQTLENIAHAEATTKSHIDKTTLVAGAIELAGILLILNYEKVDIITSKAFNRLPKLKVGK